GPGSAAAGRAAAHAGSAAALGMDADHGDGRKGRDGDMQNEGKCPAVQTGKQAGEALHVARIPCKSAASGLTRLALQLFTIQHLRSCPDVRSPQMTAI